MHAWTFEQNTNAQKHTEQDVKLVWWLTDLGIMIGSMLTLFWYIFGESVMRLILSITTETVVMHVFWSMVWMHTGWFNLSVQFELKDDKFVSSHTQMPYLVGNTYFYSHL